MTTVMTQLQQQQQHQQLWANLRPIEFRGESKLDMESHLTHLLSSCFFANRTTGATVHLISYLESAT